jgi:hypothetical protein
VYKRQPFVDTERWGGKTKEAGADRSRHWKQCHLCASEGVEHRFDLWHVLFECVKTCDTDGMVAVRSSCQAFLPRLCDALELAVERNAESMSDTRKAGVSHSEIRDAISEVQALTTGYQWNCVPGRWLVYMLLLAMPYPEVAVRPNASHPVWLCPPKRKRKGLEPLRNLRGMPATVPMLSDDQYALPAAVGRLFDRTILSSDVLRPLADDWCRLSESNLLRAGAIVRPLRVTADEQRLGAMHRAHPASEIDIRDGALSELSLSSDESPPGSVAEP